MRHAVRRLTAVACALLPASRFLLPAVAALYGVTVRAQSTQPLPATTATQHVVLVITDGLRWQEVFRGADRSLMERRYVNDTAALRRDFWRDSPEARRETLLPFLWGTVATQGQLFGDSASGSAAQIVNRFRFSYPGYSETFAGFFDPRIDSNGFGPNPNVTVFEWLNRQREFAGKVTLIVTTDHGRGHGGTWTDHGEDVEGAQYIWSAVIGPDTPPRGVRANTPTQQAQMAATIAALLGRDWRAAESRAAPALPVFR